MKPTTPKRHDQRGELNPNARLSEDLVSQILKWRAEGKSLNKIAALAHVSKSRISLICARKAWKHVS